MTADDGANPIHIPMDIEGSTNQKERQTKRTKKSAKEATTKKVTSKKTQLSLQTEKISIPADRFSQITSILIRKLRSHQALNPNNPAIKQGELISWFIENYSANKDTEEVSNCFSWLT